jgi:hypothetical protein
MNLVEKKASNAIEIYVRERMSLYYPNQSDDRKFYQTFILIKCFLYNTMPLENIVNQTFPRKLLNRVGTFSKSMMYAGIILSGIYSSSCDTRKSKPPETNLEEAIPTWNPKEAIVLALEQKEKSIPLIYDILLPKNGYPTSREDIENVYGLPSSEEPPLHNTGWNCRVRPYIEAEYSLIEDKGKYIKLVVQYDGERVMNTDINQNIHDDWPVSIDIGEYEYYANLNLYHSYLKHIYQMNKKRLDSAPWNSDKDISTRFYEHGKLALVMSTKEYPKRVEFTISITNHSEYSHKLGRVNRYVEKINPDWFRIHRVWNNIFDGVTNLVAGQTITKEYELLKQVRKVPYCRNYKSWFEIISLDRNFNAIILKSNEVRFFFKSITYRGNEARMLQRK